MKILRGTPKIRENGLDTQPKHFRYPETLQNVLFYFFDLSFRSLDILDSLKETFLSHEVPVKSKRTKCFSKPYSDLKDKSRG